MHIIVCVKQVPDTLQVRIDPESGRLIREGVPSIINPYDMHAIEAAIQLKEKYGAYLTFLSMGPPQIASSLKEAMSFGGDRAVALSDKVFGGADTLATSYTLSQAIKAIDKDISVDMVVNGKITIDGDTGQVGPQMSVMLDYNLISYVCCIEEIDWQKGEIVCQRQLESYREKVISKLPCLITIHENANKVRRVALPNLVKFSKFEPEIWNHETFDVSPNKTGVKGSPTIVRRVSSPPLKKRATMIEGGLSDSKLAVQRLFDIFSKEKAL